jgi:hypothetical protein
MRPILLALFLLPTAAVGQSLSGDWVFDGPAGVVRLSLSQEGTTLMGTMLGTDGTRFALQGDLDGARATGSVEVGGGVGWFGLGLVGERIMMVVAEIDEATGQPDLGSGWELEFSRVAGQQAPSAGEGAGRTAPASPMAAPPPGMGGAPPGAGQPATGATGAPAESETSPAVREWLGHLRGKRMSYRDSNNSSDVRGSTGYSERWDAFLCSDGTFLFQQRSRMNIDTEGMMGSSGGNNTARGRWRIVETNGAVYLQYQMEGSEGEQGLLRFENGATYLDRNRVFVTPDNPHCG